MKFHISSHTSVLPLSGASCTETAQGTTLCTPTKRPRESGTVGLFLLPLHSAWLQAAKKTLSSADTLFVFCAASGSESEATPEKRPRPEEKEGGSEEARGTPKQKNRRRCYRCQTKLELVQQELGSCRCGQYRHIHVVSVTHHGEHTLSPEYHSNSLHSVCGCKYVSDNCEN